MKTYSNISAFFHSYFKQLHPTAIRLETIISEYENTNSKEFPLPKAILKTNAIVHKSFNHEIPLIDHNEKLEFLGDAVLELYITRKLFEKYAQKTEGELSRLRSAIVNETTLAKMANIFKIQEWILVGKGECTNGGAYRDSLMSNCFEAILGAIYTQEGMNSVEEFMTEVEARFINTYNESFFDESILLEFDAKSRLQELSMKLYKKLPRYEFTALPDESGFHGKVYINDEFVLEDSGPSKKKTMQVMAKHILKNNLIEVTNVND